MFIDIVPPNASTLAPGSAIFLLGSVIAGPLLEESAVGGHIEPGPIIYVSLGRRVGVGIRAGQLNRIADRTQLNRDVLARGRGVAMAIRIGHAGRRGIAIGRIVRVATQVGRDVKDDMDGTGGGAEVHEFVSIWSSLAIQHGLCVTSSRNALRTSICMSAQCQH